MTKPTTKPINMTASSYVTGNISEKHRNRWVNAIPPLQDCLKTALQRWDDERLGMTLKACLRIRNNVKSILNKVTQRGQNGSWTKRMTEQAALLKTQKGTVVKFHEMLTAECNRREKDGAVVVPSVHKATQPEYHSAQTGSIPAKDAPAGDEVAEQRVDPKPYKDMYAMFADVPMQEILQMAEQGLNCGTSVEEMAKAKAQLKAREKDVDRLSKQVHSLEGSVARQKERVEQRDAKVKELKAKLEQQAKEIAAAKRLKAAFADLG